MTKCHGYRELGLCRLASFPDDSTVHAVWCGAMNDHLVDEAPQQRLLLLARETVCSPPFWYLRPDFCKHPPGLGIELSWYHLLMLFSFNNLFGRQLP